MPKILQATQIEETVFELFIQANYRIGNDILETLRTCYENEPLPSARSTLDQLMASYKIAANGDYPICQDTGMAVLFAQVGQDLQICGDFTQAVNNGVRRAYAEGYLRASVVGDPLFGRKNTQDNTPAVIHTELVPGDSLKLTAVPKGFGSENCSRMRMFVPSHTHDDIRDFVLETVKDAGPNTCPPSIVGVGIGGTVEKAALLAKQALTRPVGSSNSDRNYAQLEQSWLTHINRLGIGPGGLGGRTTALAVHINSFPTHIASIPVVVNLCCHAARHASRTLEGAE